MGFHTPPTAALLFTVAFIVFLFRRDIREKPNVTGALWLPLLWMLIIGSRSPTQWLAVGGYITAAYWFTASTSFANPAVTIARSLSDTFAGIRPIDVPLFVAAQLMGAAAATLLTMWLLADYSPRDRHD